MSAPVEVFIRFYLGHLPGDRQPDAAAEILRQLAVDFENNKYRPLIRHGERLVGNVFLMDADGAALPRETT